MSYLARDIMSRDVITVPASLDLRDLARLFLEKGITGAPVVDDSGKLAGVISQTDLIYYNMCRDDELTLDSHFYQTARVEGHHIPRGFQIEDCNTGCVADVMTPVVHSVTERASVDSVARLMTRQPIHRVIVRKGMKVSGIISALDVLRVHGRKNAVPGNTSDRRAASSTGKAPTKHNSKKKARPRSGVR
jgi:CBS domain-containing protein